MKRPHWIAKPSFSVDAVRILDSDGTIVPLWNSTRLCEIDAGVNAPSSYARRYQNRRGVRWQQCSRELFVTWGTSSHKLAC